MENNFKVDYIGIGVRRGATSWIQRCLIEHPQICGSKNKELSFLNDPIKYGKGIEAYAACFPNCKEGQIKGEYTPGYLPSEEAIQSVKRWFPNVKFIVSFKNPIERAFEHYLDHKTQEKTMAKTFKEAIKDKALIPYYIDTGFYYSQLKKWLDVFPRENFLILIVDDIKADPVKFIQRIYKFLGVDDSFVPPSVSIRVDFAAKNPLKIPYLNFTIVKTKRFLFHHPTIFKPFVFSARLLKINRLIELIRQANCRKKGRKPLIMPPMPESTRRYLQEIYREEIKSLEGLINRDLSFWK